MHETTYSTANYIITCIQKGIYWYELYSFQTVEYYMSVNNKKIIHVWKNLKYPFLIKMIKYFNIIRRIFKLR